MKIVVIGATGMLGHKMLKVLNLNFPGLVWGIIRQNKNILSHYQFVNEAQLIGGIDFNDVESLKAQLNLIAPQIIINCAGITLRKTENSDLIQNLNINSYLPHILDHWCSVNQAQLIHFSTDCVFSGSDTGDYKETDFPNAYDIYGKSKYLGEVKSKHSLTLRVSIVGRELFHKTELIEWFLSQKGKSVQGYSQVFYTGLTTDFLAKQIVHLIRNFPDLRGLYQISSEKISKFELLKLINTIYDCQTEIIEKLDKKSDKSLNCEKYQMATGFIKPRWEDMLKDMFIESSNLYLESQV